MKPLLPDPKFRQRKALAEGAARISESAKRNALDRCVLTARVEDAVRIEGLFESAV